MKSQVLNFEIREFGFEYSVCVKLLFKSLRTFFYSFEAIDLIDGTLYRREFFMPYLLNKTTASAVVCAFLDN